MRASNLFIFGVLLLFFACKVESVDYPPEPYVEFKDVTVWDGNDLVGNITRFVTLHVYIIDGDGNIAPFTSTEYYRNCFAPMYYKKNGEWNRYLSMSIDTVIRNNDTVTFDTLSWYNIPSPGELGQDNTLKADVFIDIEYTFIPEFPEDNQPYAFDTLLFGIQFYDLDLNESNMAISDTIIVSKTK